MAGWGAERIKILQPGSETDSLGGPKPVFTEVAEVFATIEENDREEDYRAGASLYQKEYLIQIRRSPETEPLRPNWRANYRGIDLNILSFDYDPDRKWINLRCSDLGNG